MSKSLRLHSSRGWKLDFAPIAPVHPHWQFSNLRSLGLTTLDRSERHREYIASLRYFVRRCIVHFNRLNELSLEYPGRGNYSELIHEISKCTGVQGIELGRDGFWGMVVWKLAAKSGQTLKWTDHIYYRSVPLANIGVIYQHVTNIHRQAFWRTYRTTSAGLMCRRLPSGCYNSCFCNKLSPPSFMCNCPVHNQGFTCGVASNGLDSFGRFTTHAINPS